VASPEAADYIYAAYDFDDPQGGTWQEMALTHDPNGNLTGDRLYQYKYDAWNPGHAASREGSQSLAREGPDQLLDGLAACVAVLQRALPSLGLLQRLELLEVDQFHGAPPGRGTNLSSAVAPETPEQVVGAAVVVAPVAAA
jgi:hypothetical protein